MATATTATAESTAAGGLYTGRFAPSPTGRLHLGSLTTALGSCLEARAHDGRWQLRMEDLDTPRLRPHAAERILRTLEAFGFEWDGPVVYQSSRAAAYEAALQALATSGRLYACGCSRRQLHTRAAGKEERGYPGTCRNGTDAPAPWSKRFRIETGVQILQDDSLGKREWSSQALGDPIVQRRDGVVAYQLAVVVDDAASGVTHVVRGADLLDSTPWQQQLYAALALPEPRYLHLPLVLAPGGAKLAKSECAVPLDSARAGEWLYLALTLLRQNPPTTLRYAPPAEIWRWARLTWRPQSLQGCAFVRHTGQLPAHDGSD